MNRKKTKRDLFFFRSTLFLSVFLFFLLLVYADEKSALANEPLFDIKVIIPDKYLTVFPGEDVLATIQLVNLGGAGRVDIFLDYWIVDTATETTLLLEQKETTAVETQAHFVRAFPVPWDTASGDYTLYAQITYADGKTASAKHSFSVLQKLGDKLLRIILFIIIAGFFLYLIIKQSMFFRKLWVKHVVHRIVKKRMR